MAPHQPPSHDGFWPVLDLRSAFVAGAAWWEFIQTGGTKWGTDRVAMEVEAEQRYGLLRTVSVQKMIAAEEGACVMGDAQDPMLQFFQYAHLPPELGAVSAPFYNLAELMVLTLPQNPERTVALRKLLEAKDCAVRARLYKDPS